MRRLRLLLSPNALVLVLGVALAGAATQVGVPDGPADLRISAASTGSVQARALHVSDTAGFTLTKMLPGDSGTGTVTITNKGPGPGTYDMVPGLPEDVAGAHGGLLSKTLELTVQDVTGGGAPKLLFAGKLAALRDTIALGELPAGDSRTLRYTVDWEQGGLPATLVTGDNAFIGARTSVLYRFRVTRPDAVAPQTATPVVALSRSAARSCLSRRRFTMRVRLPRGFTPVSARVFVDGKRVKVVKGKRLRATVDLQGKLAKKVKVEIAVRGTNGKTLVGSRTYRTCVKPSLSKKPAKAPKL